MARRPSFFIHLVPFLLFFLNTPIPFFFFIFSSQIYPLFKLQLLISSFFCYPTRVRTCQPCSSHSSVSSSLLPSPPRLSTFKSVVKVVPSFLRQRQLLVFPAMIYTLPPLTVAPQFADAGDQVVYHFNPKNHTVTQSSFAGPCTPKEGGVKSGL